MMKKIMLILPVILLISLSSCKKEVYNTYDAPKWSTQFGDYSESMTTVIDLPSNIKPYMTEEDEVAAFINGECRGSAVIVDDRFFMNIQGSSDEMDFITIRYYNVQNRYKYEHVTDMIFEPNGVIGTYDEPFVPQFVNI